ncbi:MAG: DNA polymerase III subunit alpha [Bacillaceae bacterium]
MEDFVHLQMQSQYSLLNSTCRIKEVVAEAKKLGYKALAITDERTMYGVVPFYRACMEEGIKPIIGLTAYVLDKEEKEAYPLVLLAKNNNGYENLIKISSALGTVHEKGIPLKVLQGYKEGLIVVSPGRHGEIERAMLKDQHKIAADVATTYREIFGDFYISIQNHDLPEETKLLMVLQELAGECDIPLVVTNDVHYIQKEEGIVHDCLQAIKNGTKVEEDTERFLGSDEYYLKSITEMNELFYSQKEWLKVASNIAEQCNVTLDFHSRHLPTFPLAEGHSADEVLKQLCIKGLEGIGKRGNKEYEERLKVELQVIAEMKFSDYFLIVWDFMKYAHEQNILTGPGRGSAAGSLVSYVLGITNVDPIEYDLLFERFLNKDRISLPDIDIDFPDYRRDEMIEYVAEKYGKLRVAQIITFGTLAAKAAIRDIGRIKGLTPKEVERLSRYIPNRLGITLTDAYEESVSLQAFLEQSPIHQEVYTIAKKIEGLPRHTSTHAAGVIMSDGKLTQYVPLQNGHGDVYTTQYDGDTLEALGLLKMDFLGLRNLTLIENVLASIQKQTGKTIDITTIPLNDKKTFSLLSRGDTTGIFQLESSGMRNVLQSLKPSELEDIVAVNALYRPGPSEQIPLYIETKHKKRKPTYLHPDLEPILKGTHGVMIYQEQIMKIASTLAGFSLSEADLLRRAVAKKKKEILDAERIPFVNGCLKKGYSEQVANDVYDLIVKFANYGFNRSHAVAYSMIGYQLAYLKAHYPTHFFSALLTSVIGNEDKIAQYISEAKQRSVEILPPSILTSDLSFHVEEKGLRYPLTAIKGVGEATAKAIVENRKKRTYQDLFDFCVRLPSRMMTKRLLETLIYAGAVDSFQQNRSTLLATIEVALDYAELVGGGEENQIDFFDDELVPKPKYKIVEEMSKEEKLQREKEALGFYLTEHPTSAFVHLVKDLKMTYISNAKDFVGRSLNLFVYIVTMKKITTKKKQPMAFLTLSDQSGEIEAVAFPMVYEKHPFREGELLYMTGRIEEKGENLQYIIEDVKTISKLREYVQHKNSKVYLKVQGHHSESILIQVKQVLRKHPGLASVIIFNEQTKKVIALTDEYAIHPDDKCLYFLRQLLGEENVVLKNR